jgi:multidrug efflux system outer membrane protein
LKVTISDLPTMVYRWWCFALVFIANGCSIGPDYRRPKLDLPTIVDGCGGKIDEFACAKWWTTFRDPTLNKLEDMALKKNADIRQAIANVEEAMAAVGMAMSDLLPSIALKGDGSETGLSRKSVIGQLGQARAGTQGAGGTQGFSSNGYESYIAKSLVAYEIDLFGKYRRSSEAARAILLASSAAKNVVTLTVTAEVAKAYFAVRALDAKLAIARRTLKTRQESYEMYKSRLTNGYCTEFDCLRVEADMRSIKAMVLDLECALEKAETALSVLIGCGPREIVVRKTTRSSSLESLGVPSDIPSGLPSDLLSRRPDVLQAEGMLMEASARIGVAESAHLPSISLTGMFGFESLSLKELFSNGSDTWNVGASISLPIFNGGKIMFGSKAARARYKRIRAAYEKSVQIAFKEVLDTLISNRKIREMVGSRIAQVNALRKGYLLARKQKEVGLIGLLDLLDVERGLLAAEMDLAGALQNQLNATVDLCKALGGGWVYGKRTRRVSNK